MNSTASARQPFQKTLRKMGFKRESAFFDTIIYTKSVGDVRVEVQLWRDGQHRACHFYRSSSDTVPSSFSTLDGMVKAVEFESTRRSVNPPPANEARDFQ